MHIYRAMTALALVTSSATALAAETTAPANPDIVVFGRAIEVIGVATAGSEGTVGYRDLDKRPLLRAGELVETVPGVIATQHSGTGKANQYFLRGFNLDHGTDFAGFVDGVPINLRTHGHGQGYLDLNFLIPELVERIDYRKGPYSVESGDFSAAGSVRMKTYDTLPAPLVEVVAGATGFYRALAAGSATVAGGDLLAALEGVKSNGPWVLNEDFRKVSGQLKYGTGPADQRITLNLTGYDARWTSTDQVPLRAIQSGLIPRLGFIDPDLGGRTSRASAAIDARLGNTSLSAYAIYYSFRLTSNFTYFLNDPVNGDEFQQRDRRGVFGGTARHVWDTSIAGIATKLRIGAETRYDAIGKVGLYASIAGVRSATIRQDKVGEYSGGAFVEAELALTSRLRAVVGLRGDAYGYDVDASIAANSGKGSDALLAPKFALAWKALDHVELYANYGESFHSNDVRGAAIRVDPVTREPADRVPVLVRARGAELGMRVEKGRFNASLVGFYLDLGSELVFVGDAGSTEPNAATRRFGTELAGFWRTTDWLSFDLSAAYTHARFRGVDPGQDRIPNSVNVVVAAGATVDLANGLSGALRLRHFGAAPLVEDGSARSKATTLVNLGTYYTLGRARFGVDVYNLLGSKDADITYYYASRLPGEPAGGVDDYHLHPVEPRQVRASVRLQL